MDRRRAELAERIFFEGAVLLGSFRLKHHDSRPGAPLSPYLFHLRTRDHPSKKGKLRHETVELAAELLAEKIFHDKRVSEGLRYFAGVPDAGEPFAAAAQQRMELRHVRRVTLKKNRTARRIDGIVGGPYPKGPAVLLDDVITQAESKMEAINVLARLELWVRCVAAVVDRQEGGRNTLQRLGYPVITLFTSTELFEFYAEEKLITPETHALIRSYIEKVRPEVEIVE